MLTPPTNNLSHSVFRIDDLAIYQTHLEIAGRQRSFDEIVRVRGGRFTLTVNLGTSVKDSDLEIAFSDGTTHKVREQRVSGQSDRHEQIVKCVGVLRGLTRQQRLTRAASELKASGSIVVGRELEDDNLLVEIGVSRRPELQPVRLQRDFLLTNGRLSFNIKECRAKGRLVLGRFTSSRRAPDEVYACDRKSLFVKNRLEALKFSVALAPRHDEDIVLALLNATADPSCVL